MNSLLLSLLLAQSSPPDLTPEELPARYGAFSALEKRRLLPLWASHGPGTAASRYTALLELLDRPDLTEADVALIAFVATRIQSPEMARKLPGRASTPELRRRYAPLFSAAPGPESFTILLELSLAKPEDEELRKHLAAALDRNCLEQVEKLLPLQPELASPLARQLLGLAPDDPADPAALALRLGVLKSRRPQSPESFPQELVERLASAYRQAAKLPAKQVLENPPSELFSAEFPPPLHRRVAPLVAFPENSPLRSLNLARSLGLCAEAFQQHHELLPRLFAADARSRAAAFNSLVDKPAPLLYPALAGLLSDRDPATRCAALEALDALAASHPIESLAASGSIKAQIAAALTDPDPEVIIAALKLSGSLQLVDLRPLVASHLSSAKPEILKAAIQAYALLNGSPEALLPLLSQRDWSLRARAIQALSTYEMPKIPADQILQALGRESEEINRVALLELLTQLDPDQSLAQLRAFCHDESRPLALRHHAAAALAKHPKVEALDLAKARPLLATASAETRLAWLAAALNKKVYQSSDLELILPPDISPQGLRQLLELASVKLIDGLEKKLQPSMAAFMSVKTLTTVFDAYSIPAEQRSAYLRHHFESLGETSPEKLLALVKFPRLKDAPEDDALVSTWGCTFGIPKEEIDILCRDLTVRITPSWPAPSRLAVKLICGESIPAAEWQDTIRSLHKIPAANEALFILLDRAPRAVLKNEVDPIFRSLDFENPGLDKFLERFEWTCLVSEEAQTEIFQSREMSLPALGRLSKHFSLPPDRVIWAIQAQQQIALKKQGPRILNLDEVTDVLTSRLDSLKLSADSLKFLASLPCPRWPDFEGSISEESQELIQRLILSGELRGEGVAPLLSSCRAVPNPRFLKIMLAAAERGHEVELQLNQEGLDFWREALESCPSIDTRALCLAVIALRYAHTEEENSPAPELPPKFLAILRQSAATAPRDSICAFLAIAKRSPGALPEELRMDLLRRFYALPLHRHALLRFIETEAVTPLEKLTLEKYNGYGYSNEIELSKTPELSPERLRSPARLALSETLLKALQAHPEEMLRQNGFIEEYTRHLDRRQFLAGLVAPMGLESESLHKLRNLYGNVEIESESLHKLRNLAGTIPGGCLKPEEIRPILTQLKGQRGDPLFLATISANLREEEALVLRQLYHADPANPALQVMIPHQLSPGESELACRYLFLKTQDITGGNIDGSPEDLAGAMVFCDKFFTDAKYRNSFNASLLPLLRSKAKSPAEVALLHLLGGSPSPQSIAELLSAARKPEADASMRCFVLHLALACQGPSAEAIRLQLELLESCPPEQRWEMLSVSPEKNWFSPLPRDLHESLEDYRKTAAHRPSSLAKLQLQLDFRGSARPPANADPALPPLLRQVAERRQKALEELRQNPDLFLGYAAHTQVLKPEEILSFYEAHPDQIGKDSASAAAVRLLQDAADPELVPILDRLAPLPFEHPGRLMEGVGPHQAQMVAPWLLAQPKAKKFLASLCDERGLLTGFDAPLPKALLEILVRAENLTPEQGRLFVNEAGEGNLNTMEQLDSFLLAKGLTQESPLLRLLQKHHLLSADSRDALIPLEADPEKRRDQALELLRFYLSSPANDVFVATPESNLFNSLRIRLAELASQAATEELLLADIPFDQGHPTRRLNCLYNLDEEFEEVKSLSYDESDKVGWDLASRRHQLHRELHAARLKVFHQLRNPSPQCLHALTLAPPRDFALLAEPYFQRQAWPEWASALILRLPPEKAKVHLQRLLRDKSKEMAESGEILWLLGKLLDSDESPRSEPILDEAYKKALKPLLPELEGLAASAKLATLPATPEEKWQAPQLPSRE
ncbi:MAG: hypothetical protein RL095_2559 [Verrucomicrobiota bacterium]|jgi:hypothetical protein